MVRLDQLSDVVSRKTVSHPKEGINCTVNYGHAYLYMGCTISKMLAENFPAISCEHAIAAMKCADTTLQLQIVP